MSERRRSRIGRPAAGSFWGKVCVADNGKSILVVEDATDLADLIAYVKSVPPVE